MADVISVRHPNPAEGGRIPFALFFCVVSLALASAASGQSSAQSSFDRDTALKISQAAIGQQLSDHRFIDSDGNMVQIADYAGVPLIISMIFTSCHHICPTTTRHLAEAVEAAEDALGEMSFQIITVGFDSMNDSPEALRTFAVEQSVNAENWKFLSASPETIAALSADIGFQFFASARGFDHLNQTTVIDRAGRVYSQVYGMQFELPWLMEPLKELVLNRPTSQGQFIDSMVDRVRLFCTVYNPATGRYEIDNSLFFQTAAGFMIVLLVSLYLWREYRHSRRQ